MRAELAGLPLLPLASGALGVIEARPRVDGVALEQLRGMGFSELRCLRAVRDRHVTAV